jgi:hypothetical protein
MYSQKWRYPDQYLTPFMNIDEEGIEIIYARGDEKGQENKLVEPNVQYMERTIGMP